MDIDGNGVMDFKEAGSQAVITEQPSNQIYFDDKAKFFVEVSADGVINYQWQMLSDTTGDAWADISDAGDFSTSSTDTLNVDNVLDYVSYWFRVMVTTPGYVCGDTVYSESVKIIESEDWDEDGIPDSQDIDDDNDGLSDLLDFCSDGNLGWTRNSTTDHDSDGCQDSSTEDLDDDNDGVADTDDNLSLIHI